MKTSPLDYLVASLWITGHLAVGLMASWLLTGATRTALGPYHVLADLAGGLLAYSLATGVSLRLLLRARPLRPGTYAMDHPSFFWWKLYTSLHEMGATVFLPFVPIFLRPAFFAYFGAAVGKGVSVGGRFMEPHLIAADDYAFFGGETIVTAHALTFGELILKPVRVGKRATVGVGSIVMPGVSIGDGAVVAAGSVVSMDTIIPAGEVWGGVPARKIKAAPGPPHASTI